MTADIIQAAFSLPVDMRDYVQNLVSVALCGLAMRLAISVLIHNLTK